jgi:hypothetical protein
VFARIEKAIESDDLSKLPRRYANLNQENLILERMRAGRVIINDGIDNSHLQRVHPGMGFSKLESRRIDRGLVYARAEIAGHR